MASRNGASKDTLAYLQSMLGELQKTASQNCDMLTYFIEMAHAEAGAILAGERPSTIRRNQRDGAA